MKDTILRQRDYQAGCSDKIIKHLQLKTGDAFYRFDIEGVPLWGAVENVLDQYAFAKITR